MKRTQKLEIRLTDAQMQDVEQRSQMLNMSKSEYARRCLSGGWCNVDTKGIAQHVYEMQTIVNTMKHLGPTMDDVKRLESEVCKIWPYLR